MLKKQRELCTNSPLPALIRIDMDVVRKIHFQQDYLGCVEDEANIIKKCDARRQEISGNIFPCLSRLLDRLMSIMMTTAVYVINSKTMSELNSVPTMAVFVSENIQRYDAYDVKNKVGIDMGAMLFWHEYQALQQDDEGTSAHMYLWCNVQCLVNLPCSWIRQVYLELCKPRHCHRHHPHHEAEEESQEDDRQPGGQ